MPVYEYGYYYDYYYPVVDPITEEPINPEKKYYPLSYDCRHSLKANLSLNIEEFFLPLLNNSVLSMCFSLYSGLPYTPVDFRGTPFGEINSSRMPGYNDLDLKYQKSFKIGQAKFSIICLINNLFNTKQVVYIYPTTGKPDDHGDPEPPITQFGWLTITSSYYSPQTDLDHNGLITPVEMRDEYIRALKNYYTNPFHYNSSFRIKFGSVWKSNGD